MAHDSEAAHGFILQTHRYYASLMQSARADSSSAAPETLNLGGQLFWVGELDAAGRALTVAANIAGAATLAATNDADGQRQAVRDGIVDFLVNSLDEALRILKNEVRKRETVAVCVAAPPDSVAHEMLERGVQPDVLRDAGMRATEREPSETQAEGHEADPLSQPALVTWTVDRAPALGLPKIDAIALECLNPEETVARRWLSRSSRYLGRLGHAEHLVLSNREFAVRFQQRLQSTVDRGEIKTGGRIEVRSSMGTESFTFRVPDSEDVAH